MNRTLLFAVIFFGALSSLAFTCVRTDFQASETCTLVVEQIEPGWYETHGCLGGCQANHQCSERTAVGPGGISETKCLCFSQVGDIPPWYVEDCSVILVHGAQGDSIECFDGGCSNGCVHNASDQTEDGIVYAVCTCQ